MLRLLAVALAGLLCTLSAKAFAQAETCREMTRYEDGGPVRVTLCKDRTGQWRTVAERPGIMASDGGRSSTQTPDIVPAGFRGEITYRGTYSGSEQIRQRQRGRMTYTMVDQPYSGNATYSLRFEGSRVIGTWQVTRRGRMMTGRFSGTRDGNVCRLFDEATRAPHVATCNSKTFNGSARNGASERVTWRTEFSANATETVDYAVRDRQRAEQARDSAPRTPTRPTSAPPGPASPVTGTALTAPAELTLRRPDISRLRYSSILKSGNWEYVVAYVRSPGKDTHILLGLARQNGASVATLLWADCSRNAFWEYENYGDFEADLYAGQGFSRDYYDFDRSTEGRISPKGSSGPAEAVYRVCAGERFGGGISIP